MRRNPFTLTATIAAAALALVVSGCSSNAKPAADEYPMGPLDEYMSTLWDGEEYTQERMDKEFAEIEDLVAACMSKEGFEYTPNPNGGGVMYSEEDDDGPAWGSVEFAKQYGYGIIDSPGMSGMAQSSDSTQEYVDPNQDYIDSLSESEQQAYYEVLWGPGPSEEEMALMEEGESFDYNWETAGCQGAAQHKVQQSQDSYTAAMEDPEFADLMTSMQDFYTALYENNEKMQALDRQWFDCMSEAGYTEFPTRMDTSMVLSNEWNTEAYPEVAEGEEWKEPSDEAKKKFQEREIAVATADAKCVEKIGYDEKAQKINTDAQQVFVDEHKDKLEALVATYGVSKK